MSIIMKIKHLHKCKLIDKKVFKDKNPSLQMNKLILWLQQIVLHRMRTSYKNKLI